MNHYTLAHTNLRVSRLAYGTWHMGGTWDKTAPTSELKERAYRLVATAVDAGINHIDLADIYTLGKSDEVVGYAFKQDPSLRDKVILQEKCGIIIGSDPEYGPPGRYDFSAEHLIKTVERSLTRLGTDRVEILTLHRPDLLVDYEEVAQAIQRLYHGGKFLHLGVSNHTAAQIELLKRYVHQPIVLNQLQISLRHHHLISDGVLANMTGFANTNTAGLLDYCRLNDILVQAWSPNAGGKVFTSDNLGGDGEHGLAQKIGEIARKHDTTEDAIALAWLLRHPMGIQPILGTLNGDRIKNSVPADRVELSRKEWYALLEAARGEPVP